MEGKRAKDMSIFVWPTFPKSTQRVKPFLFSYLAAPRGGPRRGPGGHHGRSMDDEEEMKLHAVAPGGPPEGQCKEEQDMVCTGLLTAPAIRILS